tara:strand:- start:61 stop:588 length:528 start_codon:yes stop_codon:yes gene_type:complete
MHRLIVASLVLPVTGKQGTCRCDAGDYWCSTTDKLRINLNCSGSTKGHGLWETLINLDDGPTQKICKEMIETCEIMPQPAPNRTCDDSCYDFCWIQDVGDCADDDDSQTLCVSACNQWCVAKHCNVTTPVHGSFCAKDCSLKFMEVDVKDINFISFANCMSNCTTTPVSPWGQDF